MTPNVLDLACDTYHNYHDLCDHSNQRRRED